MTRKGGEMMRFLLALVVGLSSVGLAQEGVEELLSRAEAAYDRWHGEFDFLSYEGRLREAIQLWENALPKLSQPTERHDVLVKLSRAWFELAEGYLEEKEDAYAKGKDYALSALRLDPVFRETEGREGFRAALRKSTDVEALFWYGNNLGRWLSYHYWEALVGGTRDVLAAFERCVELDEKCWAAGPHRALANFLAQTPGFLGGDFERAKGEFARAVELAPEFLQNYVDYAEHWAKKAGDQSLFCELLGKALALARDPGVVSAWPFYNHLALARAKGLARGCP
jgi:tetratricopeptide (TPR) repeat protein